jgi:hypothetical protein
VSTQTMVVYGGVEGTRMKRSRYNTNGGDGLLMWRVADDNRIFNKRPRTVDKGRSSSLGVTRWDVSSSP